MNWCSWLLTCAHTAWKSASAPLFFCTSGKETVENLKISSTQLAPCQVKRIKRQYTVRSAGCKVLVPNAGFLLASIPSYRCFTPIECIFSPRPVKTGHVGFQAFFTISRAARGSHWEATDFRTPMRHHIGQQFNSFRLDAPEVVFRPFEGGAKLHYHPRLLRGLVKRPYGTRGRCLFHE